MEKKLLLSKDQLELALRINFFNAKTAKKITDDVWDTVTKELGGIVESVKVPKTQWDKQVESIYMVYVERFGRDKTKYKLSPARRIKIIARLKDCGYEMLEKAIINASNDKFHRGENDRGWVADLDYLTRSYEIVERLSQLEETNKVVEYSIYE